MNNLIGEIDFSCYPGAFANHQLILSHKQENVEYLAFNSNSKVNVKRANAFRIFEYMEGVKREEKRLIPLFLRCKRRSAKL
jgi:hypothetical protein